MTEPLTVRVLGTEELTKKLGNRLYAAQTSRFFRAAGLTVKGRAQDKAPRWDGALVNSIRAEFDSGTPVRWAKIGTNMNYAPFVERGTRPHWPPVRAIAPWARSKGLNPFAVARAISRKGTKPHPFLEPALDESHGDILALLYRLSSEIQNQSGGA